MSTEERLKEALYLLRGARTILKECDKGPFVKDPMTTYVEEDGEDGWNGDGMCLLEEIDNFFDMEK